MMCVDWAILAATQAGLADWVEPKYQPMAGRGQPQSANTRRIRIVAVDAGRGEEEDSR
jgi:hypothetical protein